MQALKRAWVGRGTEFGALRYCETRILYTDIEVKMDDDMMEVGKF